MSLFYAIPIDFSLAEDTNVDYVFKLTEVTIEKLGTLEKTEFWDNIAADGGNVRLFGDDEKVNQLPVEVILVDTGTRDLELWGRLNRPLLASGGNTYWLELVTAGDPQMAAVNDQFGSRAVWQNYALVVHGVNDGQDSTNNYSFGVTGPDATFSRAGMFMANSRPRYNARAANQKLSVNNVTMSMELSITSVYEGNVNDVGDGISLLAGSLTPLSNTRLVIFVKQDPPLSPVRPSPPQPVPPELRGAFFGVNGPEFDGFDENGRLSYDNCTALGGELQPKFYTYAGDNFLLSGSYDVTDNPNSLLPFRGEFRFYRDGAQEGLNTTALNLPWGRARFNDSEFFISQDGATWTMKDLHIRNDTLNAVYEAAQNSNRRDEENFYGLPVLEVDPGPPPPPPDPPPAPPEPGTRTYQVWSTANIK